MESEIEITVYDFANICRFCLEHIEDFQIIADADPVIDELIKCIDNNMNKEGFPDKMCAKCLNVFNEFASFIEKCKNNHDHLQSLYVEHIVSTCKAESENCDLIAFEVVDTDDDQDSVPLAQIKSNLKKKVNKTAREVKTVKQNSVLSKCETCGYESFHLKKHYKQSVKCLPKSFICTECGKAFNRAYRLTAHMRSHTKEEPFQCTECSKTFRFKQNLARHELNHRGIKPYKCEVCGKAFARQHVKNDHMNIHTGSTPYMCSYCGKGFKRYANHFLHVHRHKLLNGEITDNEKQRLYLRLQCSICNKIFASRGALVNHLSLHEDKPREKKFLCNDCGKSFMTCAQLETHCRIHTGARPYQCTECGKQFRQRSSFNTHKLMHTGARPHKCEVCQKLFKQSAHLKIHMRTHSGEKPYACSYCAKSFALKSNLTVHTRIHTGETPFVCEVCKTGFYDSSSLKKHMKCHPNSSDSYSNDIELLKNEDI